MRPRPSASFTHQRGIALMLVLWVLTLLTVMAVSMTTTQRGELALTEHQLAATRFRLHSDAALAYMAWQFIQPLPQLEPTGGVGMTAADEAAVAATQWLPDGTPHEWQFAGTTLTLTVFNEQSRLALNHADAPTLAALLEALAVPEAEALALADALVDWRDADDLAQLNGAEDGDYEAASAAFGAKDEPFTAFEELRQVRGMTPELYQRLVPELTLTDGDDAPVLEFASAAVLAATQGIALIDAQMQQSAQVQPRSRGGPLYRVFVTAAEPAAGQQLEALLELTPAQPTPYLVHWRRFGQADAAPPLVAVDGEQ